MNLINGFSESMTHSIYLKKRKKEALNRVNYEVHRALRTRKKERKKKDKTGKREEGISKSKKKKKKRNPREISNSPAKLSDLTITICIISSLPLKRLAPLR